MWTLRWTKKASDFFCSRQNKGFVLSIQALTWASSVRAPSTSTHDASFNRGAEPEVGPLRSSSFNARVDSQLEVANAGSVNDSEGDHPNSLSAVSPSPAQPEQSDPADLGSRTNLDQPDRDTGKSTMVVETALTVVKESLKVIARVSDVFPPLKAVAEGLGVVFDRIAVSLLSSVPVLSM